MIIQCPACTTRYVVPDAAIGVDGRTVRCAKCRHSWFQDGPTLENSDLTKPDKTGKAATPAAPRPASPPGPAPAQSQVEDDAKVSAPPSDIQDAEEEQADSPHEEPAAPTEGPSAASQRDVIRPPRSEPADFGDPPASAFDHEPPFRPRRNWLKLWTWAAGIFALVVAGLIFAVSYWGLPDWVPVEQPTFAAGQPDLELDFPPDQQERRTLPNGTEFFGASGTITNIGTTARNIPTILIVLRDSRDRIVYSWEVPPPQRTIAPGETIPVSEAVTDIPRSAREVQIGWKPE
ncbi:MJ0042-type zinc finger domain-containing protein [Erythrobacter alti]|uniref:zinc-ribbon domain-containing protein n=1 Tax=Erythrobacter alti TaxID=1896145 RepID=UPI0030F4A7A3